MGFMIKCVSVKGSLLACKCEGFLYDVKIGSSMFYLGMCNLVYEGFIDLGIMNDSVNVSELYRFVVLGVDPVAVLRWSVVRAFFRCFFAFISAGKRYRATGGKVPSPHYRLFV